MATENITVVTRFWIVLEIKIGELAMFMALPSVIVLPISYFLYQGKIGGHALLGTALAITGVAILFLA